MNDDDVKQIQKAAAVVLAIVAAAAVFNAVAFFLDWRASKPRAAVAVDETRQAITATADANARRVDMIFDELKAKEAQIVEKTDSSSSNDLAVELGSLLADYRKKP